MILCSHLQWEDPVDFNQVCWNVEKCRAVHLVMIYAYVNNIFFFFKCFNMKLLEQHVSDGNQRVIIIIGNWLRVPLILSLISCTYGNVYFQANPLLEGSVSTRCSLDNCRSAVEAAVGCYNTSTCLAIATERLDKKHCLSCACPADGAALNKDGIFYIKNVEPYLRGEFSVLCYVIKSHCVPYSITPIIPSRWIEMTVQWASCQMRKIVGCACAGNAGNFFPATAG